MNHLQSVCCKINDLEINEATSSVSRSGQPIALPLLSFKLLLVLCKNAPAIVSNQQLIQQVWENKVVSDDTIQQRVKLLRQALGDDPKSPTYIATIRGQGYRLIHTVEDISIENQKKHKQKLLIKITAYTLSVIALIFISINFNSSSSTLEQSSNPQAEETVTNFDKDKHSTIEAARNYYFNGKDYLNRRTETSNRAALMQFEKAIELDPGYALAYTGVAHISAERYKHFEKKSELLNTAEQAALKAISLRPDIYETHHALAISYHTAQKIPEAKEAYRKVLSIHSNHSQSLNNLSYLERLDGNYHESLMLAFKQVKAAPRKPLSYVQVAENYINLGHHNLAVLWHQKALSLAPQNRYIQFSICRLHIKLKNLDAAEKSCNFMVDWAPDDAWGYEWVGHLALLKGERKKAIENYRSAMELDSNYSKFRYPSLVISMPGQDPVMLKASMEESHKKMLSFIEESPDSIGDILNICDFYAVTENKKQLLFWMRKLLENGFTDYRSFLYTDIYGKYHDEPDFVELLNQFKTNQLKLQNSIEKHLIISPQQFNELDFTLIE
ncbi:MAG: winged helix-turn-helix domain-containing protein [Kangiellaceae bacterium]|nr:winged helix-turn-helix domain-containing protein [Kangiellaceae bacterium]